MSDIETRLMGGSLSVTFGPGLNISTIKNSTSSPVIAVHNLAQSTQKEDLIALLFSFKDDIDHNAIRIVKTAEVVYATVDLGDSTTADTVVKALNGLSYEEGTLSVKLLQEKGLLSSASQNTTRMSCKWFAPATTAYANFGSYAGAQAAAGGERKMIRGRLVECKHQRPGIRQTPSVRIEGLDPRTTVEDIKRVLECNSVKISKPSYSISEEEAATRVRSLFDQKKQIEGFDIVSEPNARKTRAIIQFRTEEDARVSFKAFNGQKQEFLGNSPLDLGLIFSVKFKILAEIYRAVASELKQISRRGEERFVKVRIFDGDNYPSVTIKVHGPERGPVASTKAVIQKVIRGEIGCDEKGGVLWDPFLNTPEGMELIRDTISSTGAHIYSDQRKRQLSLYGSPAACTEARTKLIAEIKRINGETREIQLGALSLRKAMRGGLRAKLNQLGYQRFLIDNTRKCILFQGTSAEATLVEQCLSKILEKQGEAPKNDGENCLFCMEEPEDPRTAPCGHRYCRACLERYLRSAIDINADTQKFPLKCFGKQNAPACATELPIPFIEKVGLSKADMDKLFAAAFDEYIQLHIKDYRYCSTPGCCGVYPTTATGEVVTCSECFVGICTTCHVEAHDGQTCAEKQRSDPGEGEILFEEWKKETDARACPHCNIHIVKNGGCNHIMCVGCKSHICWFCMKVVKNGIYEHMADQHGGHGDPDDGDW